MKRIRRIRAMLGIDMEDVPGVITRAELMHAGMGADLATYGAASPPLPVFLGLLQNLVLSQQQVRTRGRGLAAARDVDCDLLVTAMQSARMFVQTLDDASPSRAIVLIQNAGLLVAAPPVYDKPLLKLTLGVLPGTILCVAHVGLLVREGAVRPRAGRFLEWGYTLDGGQTFVSPDPTPGCKTVLEGLPRLTLVGVRVRVADMAGPRAWSHVETITVL